MMHTIWRKTGYFAGVGMMGVMLLFSGVNAKAQENTEAVTTEQMIVEQPTTEQPTTQQVTTQKPVVEKPTITNTKKAKFVKKNGIKYYINEKGKKVKNQFITVKKKTYYLTKKGAVQTGWMKKGGNYYYFDRSTGVQKKNGTVDGIKLKNGKAKKDAYSVKKIRAMMKAAELVAKNTKATDGKEAKLKKMFYWVVQGPYKRYRRLREVRTTKGWEIDYANDMLMGSGRAGCCVSNACTLAYFARECGYKTVYVCDDTDHAWVEIDGMVYDTLFSEMRAHGGSTKNPNYKGYFKSTYQKTRLVCVNRLKV